MGNKEALQLFGEKRIRTAWNQEEEKWYFSIVDVCEVLTDSKDYLTARKYWNKLKQRLVEEGNETVTNCHQLKLLAADGKQRLTDVADQQQLFRLIQSIPSPKPVNRTPSLRVNKSLVKAAPSPATPARILKNVLAAL